MERENPSGEQWKKFEQLVVSGQSRSYSELIYGELGSMHRHREYADRRVRPLKKNTKRNRTKEK